MAILKHRFKGHEKFILRDGWINKGITLVKEDSKIFQDKNAAVLLGVGNNMVKSLRYWLKAMQLTKESSKYGAELTELGELVLKYDRYLEDEFTLWLLHINLVRNKEVATTWNVFFNRCDILDLNRKEVVETLKNEIEREYIGIKYAESAIKDDVDVLLNMYSKIKEHDYDPEDNKTSPLSDLKLIRSDKGRYSKSQPDIKKINSLIILYIILLLKNNEETLSLDNILNGTEYSIGISALFNLNKNLVNAYLDKLENLQYIKVIRTARLDYISFDKAITSKEVIEEYYTKRRGV